SYNNQQVGLNTPTVGESKTLAATAAPGDWGGFVFRDNSDHERQGIFLNYVNEADISYGGGTVVVDSVPQSFDSIHLVHARPTLTNNTILASADAVISADPD